MKNNKTEVIWLISIFIISLLIGSQLFGLKNFISWGVDINIHDTYFVIDSINSFLSLTFLLIFITFLPKIIIQKFENLFSNFTFLVANGYLIFLTTFLISIMVLLSTTKMPTSGVSEKGWTIYPPLTSGPSVDELIDYNYIRQVLIASQIVLILLFGLVAYKSGSKIKKRNS